MLHNLRVRGKGFKALDLLRRESGLLDDFCFGLVADSAVLYHFSCILVAFCGFRNLRHELPNPHFCVKYRFGTLGVVIRHTVKRVSVQPTI